MRSRLPTFVKIWFGIDLALSLFPPIHWSLNGLAPVAGIPATLAYVLGMSAFAGASLVVAYSADLGEPRRTGA